MKTKKKKKVCCTIFQMCTPTRPTAHLRRKQAVRKWLWSGDTSTEMENEGFTRCEINKNIIASTEAVKSHSKAKLSPADGVAGWLLKELCGKLGSDGVTSFNQMFARTCVRRSYTTAPMAKWSEDAWNKSVCFRAKLSQSALIEPTAPRLVGYGQ